MRLFASLAILVVLSAYAADVRVLGLFPERALLDVDGQQKLLRVGESLNGIRLIAADSERAVLEIDGKRNVYRLGQDMHTSMATAPQRQAQIARGSNGHYNTVLSINGQLLSAMIDTGATTVAMSQRTADRLGLAYRVQGVATLVNTAAGTVRAWSLRLPRVRLGEIERHDVEAMVIEGDAPGEVLVGMSFLSGLHMRDENNVLYLQASF